MNHDTTLTTNPEALATTFNELTAERDHYRRAMLSARADADACRQKAVGLTQANEGLIREVAQLNTERDTARAEEEKFRAAASVLCAKHIGVPLTKCPVCAFVEERSARNLVREERDELKGKLANNPLADTVLNLSNQLLEATKEHSKAMAHADGKIATLKAELVQARLVANGQHTAPCVARLEAVIAAALKAVGEGVSGDLDSQLPEALYRAHRILAFQTVDGEPALPAAPPASSPAPCELKTTNTTAHAFARRLLDGPDLPIACPDVKTYAGEDEEHTSMHPPGVSELPGVVAGVEQTVLVIS